MSKILAAFLLSLSGLTFATVHFVPYSFWSGLTSGGKDNVGGGSVSHFSAPEIDPSSAISAITLLVGGLTVLRGRIGKG